MNSRKNLHDARALPMTRVLATLTRRPIGPPMGDRPTGLRDGRRGPRTARFRINPGPATTGSAAPSSPRRLTGAPPAGRLIGHRSVTNQWPTRPATFPWCTARRC